MTQPYSGVSPDRAYRSPAPQPASLADVLELVLDKGIVIAGDIKINLLDIELLTIKLRLLIASVDKARELGIDWWESDPSLSSSARPQDGNGHGGGDTAELSRRIEALEQRLTVTNRTPKSRR
jgi:hypothetical protein